MQYQNGLTEDERIKETLNRRKQQDLYRGLLDMQEEASKMKAKMDRQTQIEKEREDLKVEMIPGFSDKERMKKAVIAQIIRESVNKKDYKIGRASCRARVSSPV